MDRSTFYDKYKSQNHTDILSIYDLCTPLAHVEVGNFLLINLLDKRLTYVALKPDLGTFIRFVEIVLDETRFDDEFDFAAYAGISINGKVFTHFSKELVVSLENAQEVFFTWSDNDQAANYDFTFVKDTDAGAEAPTNDQS